MEENTNTKQAKSLPSKGIGLNRSIIIRTLIAGVLLFGCGVLIIMYVINGTQPGWESKAQIGDAMNILTAFFTALAFAGVVLSLWFQQKELQTTLDELQKSEDSNTQLLNAQYEVTKVMREQSEAMLKQAEAIHQQAIATYRPYITVYLELSKDTAYYLIIENLGKTSAQNLTLSTDHNFSYPGVNREDFGVLSNALAFQHPIGSFAPGQRLVYFIGTGKAIHEEDPEFEEHPFHFSVSANYSFNDDSIRVEETTLIDMRQHRNNILYAVRRDRELTRIANSSEKIEKRLEKLEGISKSIANNILK